ncbi:histidine--tRNA ligase [Elongatibacter sediminis]|uniref:Histidine--tRNA ligase n=1 Tax=Elongatibacter sediminis TaxID=3119006 RepID=A0AAW9RDR7_9GAMM
MTSTIQSIRGMHDILPSDLPAWQRLEQTVADIFTRYAYSEIRIPVVEKTELFARAIGDATDVVEKEMYTFEDRNGDQLSLRPEGTAGVVRAVLQNGLLYATPLRLWYAGPMFRRERPQKGRTRQFHQIGAEVFGAHGPDVDAELLALCKRLWDALGIGGLRLEINSLGTAEERAAYREALKTYFAAHPDALDADSQRRLERNPLRILDSKNPDMRELIAGAPALDSYLGEASRDHFDTLRRYLDDLGVAHRVNPRLVRGLDYYSHTVFEWITDELGAQGTVCAGGRYDGLVEIQGGKPWPGIGFAMGQERLVELMRLNRKESGAAPHLYFVLVGDSTTSAGLALAERLRSALPGLRIQLNLAGGSFKAQFRRADRSEAPLALILGEEEVNNQTVSIKPLREAGSQQERMPVEDLENWLRKWLSDTTARGPVSDPPMH